VRGSPANRGRRGPGRAVRARLFRQPSRVGGESCAVTGRWDGATVKIVRVRGGLRGRGAQLSMPVRSTVFNVVDSGP